MQRARLAYVSCHERGRTSTRGGDEIQISGQVAQHEVEVRALLSGPDPADYSDHLFVDNLVALLSHSGA